MIINVNQFQDPILVNMPVACGKKTDQKIIHSISQEVAAAGI
jgi:hypothetical protein